ncbi:hypothetical protein [Diplocloster agilis]|uniref:Uncharacterized protein n=1 Tax=Diplocloster agilis TaxID=2850323 RepID=A0A949JUD8_9FIRM|nr:hypothetical protein [Diplocloster agilis]MBU9735293.1 hypothetical protein [Diplocloster agilis]
MKKYLCVLIIGMIILMSGCGKTSAGIPPYQQIDEIIEQFNNNGMTMESTDKISKNLPNGCKASVSFTDEDMAARMEANVFNDYQDSGVIEIYKNNEKAVKAAQEFEDSIKYPFGFLIIKDNVLLKLNVHYSDAYVELYCESIGGELYKKFRVEQIITSEKTQENTIFTEEERKSINEVSYSNGDKTTWIKSGNVYDAITKIYPKVTLQCLENTESSDEKVKNLFIEIDPSKVDFYESLVTYMSITKEIVQQCSTELMGENYTCIIAAYDPSKESVDIKYGVLHFNIIPTSDGLHLEEGELGNVVGDLGSNPLIIRDRPNIVVDLVKAEDESGIVEIK